MARAGKELTAPEQYIETPAPAVSRMGSADRGNSRSVTRDGEPVMDCSSDLAALHRRLSRPVVASDEQDKAVPGIFGTL